MTATYGRPRSNDDWDDIYMDAESNGEGEARAMVRYAYEAGHREASKSVADLLVALVGVDGARRRCVQYLKERFLGWRIPPVELPAESVIEDVVTFIAEEVARDKNATF